MPQSVVEIERAFSPGPEAQVPDLTSLGAVSAVESAGEQQLDATYYDVPGLVLLRAGVTFRRRSGGSDEGWHLKLPSDLPSARIELHADLDTDDSGPPARLVELVSGWSRGVALAPVARIRTRRRTSRLVGADGAVIGELADDLVEGLPAQLGGERRRWREWEVELRTADSGLLDEVESLFVEHGVERSAQQRKLSLVLDVGPTPDVDAIAGTLTKKSPAGHFLHRWVLEQVRDMELLDPMVRDGGAGGVHGMRKACRRLRAALATCRPLVDREQTDPVRDELRWLARALGQARDDEVVLKRIEALLGDEPPGTELSAAHRTLEKHSVSRASQDQANVSAIMTSRRYFALRSALDELASEPLWTAKADQPARDVLPRLVRKETTRVDRRHRSDDPHELRKAAKRLRYAYELVEPAWGKDASRPRKAARELTRVLGERQDTLVSREWLVALASQAEGRQDAFLFGRLHAREVQHELDLLDQAEPLWGDLEHRVW
jgi:CHAD domain-containing protein